MPPEFNSNLNLMQKYDQIENARQNRFDSQIPSFQNNWQKRHFQSSKQLNNTKSDL